MSARKKAIPFGVFLALGGIVGVLAGPELVDLYEDNSSLAGVQSDLDIRGPALRLSSRKPIPGGTPMALSLRKS